MSGVLYALGILLALVVGIGLGLRRSPSPKRRLALVEEAVRRRYKGRVELRSAAFLSVFKGEGVMAVVVADRGEAIGALADRLVRQVESAEAEARKKKKEAEGPSCARWEDGTRTEIWRVFSWCSGDEHADRMCWLLDDYLRGIGRDPDELRRGAPNMGRE